MNLKIVLFFVLSVNLALCESKTCLEEVTYDYNIHKHNNHPPNYQYIKLNLLKKCYNQCNLVIPCMKKNLCCIESKEFVEDKWNEYTKEYTNKIVKVLNNQQKNVKVTNNQIMFVYLMHAVTLIVVGLCVCYFLFC